MTAATTISPPWKKYCQVWREVEEDGRVEDLDDEAGAEQGADERAPAAQQAGAAEHHGGDAAQRVADALGRVADAELREQDDDAEEDEARDAAT